MANVKNQNTHKHTVTHTVAHTHTHTQRTGQKQYAPVLYRGMERWGKDDHKDTHIDISLAFGQTVAECSTFARAF